jgi:hypothetical protein
MFSEHITPETMKLNEVQPNGFVTEPRILSHEVAKMREQVAALCDAVLQLVELQREANKKIEAALHPIRAEAA